MKPYMPWLFDRLCNAKRLFIPKSREMMLSWAVMGYAVWLCQWHPEIRVIVQSAREDKSVDLVTGGERPGYCRVLWERQPDFLKNLHPLTKPIEEMARDVMAWKNGSEIRGVPAGGDQFRQYHPYWCILEEASFLPEAEASYGAALPVASQIICVSSAGPGWFMDTCDAIMELPQDTNRSTIVQMEVPKGCTWKRDPKTGIEVLKIHYSADPEKDSVWVAQTKPTYKSEQLWMREQEIKGDAFSGQLLFPEFQRQYTLIEPRPIPANATFAMAIDPHPRRPYAFLWLWIQEDGDWVVFREYWPSKIYGKRGRMPEDDALHTIDEYCATIQFLEGPEPNLWAPGGFSDNQARKQIQHWRIMDTTGKVFYTERKLGRDEPETFWDTYQRQGIVCDPAKKDDFNAGRDAVARMLKPLKYIYPWGEEEHSQLRIIGKCCPELVLELETNRYPLLKPGQVDTREPAEKPLELRRHLTDLLGYLRIADLHWVNPHPDELVQPGPYPDIPGYRPW